VDALRGSASVVVEWSDYESDGDDEHNLFAESPAQPSHLDPVADPRGAHGDACDHNHHGAAGVPRLVNSKDCQTP